MMELDRQNFLVGCMALVVAVVLFILVCAWAGVRATESVSDRHVAGYEACANAESTQVVACVLQVKR